MRMRCNDCGVTLTELNRAKCSRSDLCSSCWDTRTNLVKMGFQNIQPEVFREIQRKMAGGRGTAKRFIDEFLPDLAEQAEKLALEE